MAKRDIDVFTETTVLSLTKDKTITAINETLGVFTLTAKAIILAMGCRERSKGALNIAGSRPAGLYSAGTAQKYVNIKGYLPGKEVVILGSGDIGLIMARRMTLEGATVRAVCEIMPYSSGLKRNIVQCLDDFGIPLYLSHTITKIEGEDRVSAVTISQVDENKRPIKGTEKRFTCDTVLFSVGLIPENELTKNAGIELYPNTKGAVVNQDRETSVPGIFACGNVLHVHDLVDFVSEEAEIAGVSAAKYVTGGLSQSSAVNCVCGQNISYVLPQIINKSANAVKLFFRVKNVFKNCAVKVETEDEVILYKRKRIALPGEMETIVIPQDKIGKLSGTVKVSLEVENG